MPGKEVSSIYRMYLVKTGQEKVTAFFDLLVSRQPSPSELARGLSSAA